MSAPIPNAEVPVGTVITSFLTWIEFEATAEDNKANPGGNFWTSEYSKWSPADGRAVPGSRFKSVTGDANVPDLRGVFVRGLNNFDTTVGGVNPSLGDPDAGRGRGSYQQDQIVDHTHSFGVPDWQVSNGNGPYPDGLCWHGNTRDSSPTGPPSAANGPETRPRNVALHYYIRIN